MELPHLLPHSRVYTFYSYKGGVGRSFAMANCATILAHWGYRVICLDWDLEAPGLQFYFPGINASRSGVVDWIINGRRKVLPLIQTALKKPFIGMLSVISAGRQSGTGDYHKRLNSINWESLYSQKGDDER
jgi:MinD-like ATPase involved in chromosome partitioning or flagellar assembly